MNDEMFVLIEASNLSMDDEFMQYQPRKRYHLMDNREKEFKDLLEKVIKNGIEDFWRPRLDPSLDETGNICFKAGKSPVSGKNYKWWCEQAERFNPERKSRLGTREQYVAFLGVLIKTLVAEGWTVDEAWCAVCYDSVRLGNYLDSEGEKGCLEPTGSRVIAGFYDLANTSKILADHENVGLFWLASGHFFTYGYHIPLADCKHFNCSDKRPIWGVSWIVMD